MEKENKDIEQEKKTFLRKKSGLKTDDAESVNLESSDNDSEKPKEIQSNFKAKARKPRAKKVVKAVTKKTENTITNTKKTQTSSDSNKIAETKKHRQPHKKSAGNLKREPIVSKGSEDTIFQKRPNVKAGNLAGGGNKTGRNYRQNKPNDNRNTRRFSGVDARNSAGQRTQASGFKVQGFGQNKAGKMPAINTERSNTKKSIRGRKSVYNKKVKKDIEEKTFQRKKRTVDLLSAVPESIEMLDSITISELAKKMNLKAATLIGKLMEMGMMVTMNQSIDYETAAILASEYKCEVRQVSLYDETVIKTESDEGATMLSRPPVVTIMGHVDHGKTKTLDAIRSSNVIAGEFGGITQHIGAYMVETAGGKITFLDTPGHEAFTMMRARGAALTDIVVLVVAADDGVMPQTVEAINHAKDAKVPIIVAINKIDKPEANPEKIMTRLSELDLMPEAWGGDTMYVEISALKKTGIDKLLEAILLQAEILELQANYNCRAEGKVVESRIDHGRGIVATILIQRGTLKTGDSYVAGIYSGKVRAIFNDKGESIEKATPSMPVEILGLEGMPNAGDPFQVASSEKEARQISEKRQELKRFEASQNVKKVTLDNLYDTISEGEMLELKVIVKGDVQGSVEALKQSLEKLSNKEIRLNVIHGSAGAINESDVMLAVADSNAMIIGFNVRPTPQAKAIADQEKIEIRKYNVIYDAVEEMKKAMEGMLSPDIQEKVIGMAEVREVFKVHKTGRIAGLYVTEGVIKRSAYINVIREGIVIYSGKLGSLKRFKDDAREVSQGFECGASFENFNDIQVGDQFEVIEKVEVTRKLDFDNKEDEKKQEIEHEKI